MSKHIMPIAVTLVLSLSLLLTGCGTSSNAGLDMDTDSSEKDLPEWLKQSYPVDSSFPLVSEEEVYQMDELPITDEHSDESLRGPDSEKAAVASAASQTGETIVQSKQQTSVPDVPQYNVGSIWHDLQTSGGTKPAGSSVFQHDVQMSTEE